MLNVAHLTYAVLNVIQFLLAMVNSIQYGANHHAECCTSGLCCADCDIIFYFHRHSAWDGEYYILNPLRAECCTFDPQHATQLGSLW